MRSQTLKPNLVFLILRKNLGEFFDEHFTSCAETDPSSRDRLPPY